MVLLSIDIFLLSLVSNGDIPLGPETRKYVCIALLSAATFILGPPVSFVDGIFIVDIVPVSQVSFASGLVGCVGYIGPILHNLFVPGWTEEKDQRWFVSNLISLGIMFFIGQLAVRSYRF
jgi:sugar phosphate permease